MNKLFFTVYAGRDKYTAGQFVNARSPLGRRQLVPVCANAIYCGA